MARPPIGSSRWLGWYGGGLKSPAGRGCVSPARSWGVKKRGNDLVAKEDSGKLPVVVQAHRRAGGFARAGAPVPDEPGPAVSPCSWLWPGQILSLFRKHSGKTRVNRCQSVSDGIDCQYLRVFLRRKKAVFLCPLIGRPLACALSAGHKAPLAPGLAGGLPSSPPLLTAIRLDCL